MKIDIVETNKCNDESKLSQIEAEIKQLKKTTALGIMEIGDKLLEAKEIVPFGEWERWLSNNVSLSLRTARNFMMVARGFSDKERQALADLEITKIYYLAGLSEEKRNTLLASKDVYGMSTRELKNEIQRSESERILLSAIFTDEMKEMTKRILESTDIELIAWWRDNLLIPLSRGISEIVVDLEEKIGELLITK